MRACNSSYFDTYGKDNQSQAEPLIARALALCKQLGPLHPDVASILYDLAGLYITQGKYDQGRWLRKHALVVYVLLFRSDDRNMASDLRNLAFHYDDQKKDEQAELLFKRALMVSEAHDQKTFDDEQRRAKFNLTEQSLNDLAIFYTGQRRYGEAEPLFRRAIALCRQRLGTDHSVTAVFRENLAILLRARSMMERKRKAPEIEKRERKTIVFLSCFRT